MNLNKFEIGKFNKQEIEIINNFIKIYNPNYKGDLEEFIKNPKITKYINKESNISENEISHVFNELNCLNKNVNEIMFDPLFRFCKNADSYMLFLSLYEIKNGNCTFIIPINEINEMSDENKDKYYSYYLHVKLMFKCVDVYNYIMYEDFKKMKNRNNEIKYILLFPYLFMINSHKIENLDETIELSQDIPYTNSNEINKFIFNLWNNMMCQNEIED